MTVLRGRGDGTFEPGTHIPTGASPAAIDVGDFDGDGTTDFVATDPPGDHFTVHLGRGDGTFDPGKLFPLVTSSGSFSLIVDDFNGDGRLDLATGNTWTVDVSVILGNGDGTFGGAPSYRVGRWPFSIAAADFDSDGRDDVVTANGASHDVTVLLAGPGGRLAAGVSYAAGPNPSSVAVGDFNKDGRVDLVTNAGPHNVAVLLGNGDGTFAAPVWHDAGEPPWSVAVADLDADGQQDLVVANPFSNGVTVLKGRMDASFGDARFFPTGRLPFWVSTGDVDGNGVEDVVAVNRISGDATAILNDGRSTVRSAFHHGGPDAAALVDFNGDGRLDLLIPAFDRIELLRGTGTGAFTDASWVHAGKFATSLAAGDFNNDGLKDAAATSTFDGDVTVLFGNQEFRSSTGRLLGAGLSPISAAVGDYNGDGLQDLATADLYEDSVSVLLNRSGGLQDCSPCVAWKNHGEYRRCVGAGGPSASIGPRGHNVVWPEAGKGGIVEGCDVGSSCGNHVRQTGEQCDGPDLGGETCESLGLGGGTLRCWACSLNTDLCTPAPSR